MSQSIAVHAPVNLAVLDDKGPGGAHHLYAIQHGGPSEVCTVQFQRGARGEPGSTAGVFDDALLAIVQHRMECFQAGPFASDYNHIACEAIKAAREALADRVAERMGRAVLGREVA